MIKDIWLWITHVHDYKDYGTYEYIQHGGMHGYIKITHVSRCETCKKFKKYIVKIRK
jgi:hypothetical protein